MSPADDPKVPSGGRHSPRSQRGAQSRERELEALRLRSLGLTYRQIGDALGVSHQSATRIVDRGLAYRREEIAEQADTLRAIEAEKLDRVEEAIWPAVLEQNERKIETWIKLSRRRAELLGLDLGRREHDGPTFVMVDTRAPWDRRPGEPGYQAGEVVEGETVEPEDGPPALGPGGGG